MSRRPHLTARGQTFLAMGVTIGAIGVLLGFPDLTRIGVLLTCLPLVAVVLGVRPAPWLRVHRDVRPALTAPGTVAHVRLTLRNAGSRASGLRLAEEQVSGALGAAPRFLVPRMDRGEEHVISYPVSATTRGRYLLGPLQLEQRDPFGMASTRHAIPGEHEFLVLPRIEPLGPTGPRSSGVGRSGEVPHVVALLGEDDATIREYQHGDDLRRVHWPTTAHRGTLMVRQEDRPERRRAVLLLDTRAPAFGRAPEAFEWAVSAIASVAVHLDARGYVVHVAGLGPLPVTPGDLRPTLRALALVAARSQDLTATLRAAQPLATEGATVVAAVADHDPEQLLRLAAIRRPGSTGIAFVLATSSFASRPGGGSAAFGGSPPPGVVPDRDDEITGALADAGWRARTVVAGAQVPDCWAATTRRPAPRPAPAGPGSTR